MRHFLASIATYIIIAFLFGAAVLFGAVRSAQVVVSDETTVLTQYAPGPERFEWEELGAGSYLRNCENCHGAQGKGWDQYPGLDHIGLLFLAPKGRDYVIDLHLYGLTSDRWGAPMPPMGHMHDIQLAAVLNHVLTRFGNETVVGKDVALYEPLDIAARRDQGLTPRQMEERRPDVPLPAPR